MCIHCGYSKTLSRNDVFVVISLDISYNKIIIIQIVTRILINH